MHFYAITVFLLMDASVEVIWLLRLAAIRALLVGRCRAAAARPSPVAARASRNMVLQKGQAVAMVRCAGCGEFGGADLADAFAGFFAEEGEPAAGSAAEAAFVVAWGFDQLAGAGDDGARLVVDVAIAAQVAGVVEDDLFELGALPGLKPLYALPNGLKPPPSWRKFVRVTGQELAVVLDSGGVPYSFQSSWMVRTQWGQMVTIFLTLFCARVSRLASASCWKRRSLPRRRTGSPVHFSLRSTP